MRAARKQLNIRIEQAVYHSIEAIARKERRSVPQAAKLLMEEGMRSRQDMTSVPDDAPGLEIGRLASAGGAFDWLTDEPDLYDDSSGEPL